MPYILRVVFDMVIAALMLLGAALLSIVVADVIAYSNTFIAHHHNKFLLFLGYGTAPVWVELFNFFVRAVSYIAAVGSLFLKTLDLGRG